MFNLKLAKKISLVLTIALCVLIVFDFSFAVDTGKIKEEFANPSSSGLQTTTMKNTIFTILTYIGYGSAVVVTLWTGIGFIIATPAQKAKLKEKLWLIAFGVALLAGGIPLVQAISNIFNTIGEKL